MNQKLALIATRRGPWISVREMLRPLLLVRGEATLEVSVCHVEEPHTATPDYLHVVGPCEYGLPKCLWVMVEVAEGSPHENIVCIIREGRG